ncbi:FAD-dependent oxidoreductase [Streptomyces sp. DH37]|uniref:FAD-dependent oxidoreductase n=1 Tax=Streptomyces sp. DH37 TaxID=3040122 RepID=UPI00244280F5|nr:FAD-dependent oxidoreductase [Streptomyces sp. DH37]
MGGVTDGVRDTAHAGEADLLVVGGGPAGCAAAVTAAGVGMRTLLLEAGPELCGKLRYVRSLGNVLGGFSSGPEFAAAAAGDVARAAGCRVEYGARVVRLTARDDHVAVTLASGERRTAAHAVVATGTGPLRPADTDWAADPGGRAAGPLWEADPAALSGRTVLVLGADRPLGTLLRADPSADVRFLVAHPPSDGYKTAEVRADRRVELVPVRRVVLRGGPGRRAGVAAEIATAAGGSLRWTADVAYLNIGSGPVRVPGDLVADAGGHCPPGAQRPRVHVAGDLRSPRAQRIMTAMGSGGEAALRAYYALRGLPG